LDSNKKILIITYYWPPAGGPGVQRWLKFAKYLPEFGWTPTIFTPANPSYPIVDDTLVQEVSDDLDIIRTKIWEPYQLAEMFGKENKKFKSGQFDVGKNQTWKSKLSIWVRGNFFIPDARVFWVKPSVKYLKKYLKENHFDAFVTTGPPHSLHLIGLELKKEFPGLKWIADFRDPWTEISYYKQLKLSKTADQKHRKLEQQVFNRADITLATSFTDAENFRKIGANAVCITNGFDGNAEESKIRNRKFTLSYIGVLEQLRNPELLWKVLDDLIHHNSEFRNNFELKFVGRIDDRILHQIKDLELRNSVRNLGYLNHRAAQTEMQSSDLLLITNFPNENSQGIIPGKIFEYLATGRQILSFGPPQSDVKRILEETGAGQHFSYENEDELKAFLLKQFRNWKEGNLTTGKRDITQYSRKFLTGKLAEIL
jgi:glycosyltransferase involved in cell wall biosynthesis